MNVYISEFVGYLTYGKFVLSEKFFRFVYFECVKMAYGTDAEILAEKVAQLRFADKKLRAYFL